MEETFQIFELIDENPESKIEELEQRIEQLQLQNKTLLRQKKILENHLLELSQNGLRICKKLLNTEQQVEKLNEKIRLLTQEKEQANKLEMKKPNIIESQQIKTTFKNREIAFEKLKKDIENYFSTFSVEISKTQTKENGINSQIDSKKKALIIFINEINTQFDVKTLFSSILSKIF